MTAVEIARVAAGGAGVGRLADGMTVFVPRAAPGDLVEIDVVRRKKRYALGRLVRIVRPGPHRIEPACAHYVHDDCGGCQLQHVDGDAQAAFKARLVGDALRRIGQRATPDPALVPSPTPWRYRSKITLAARDGRIGLHPHGRPDTVFDLFDCAITSRAVMDLVHRLKAHRRLLPADLVALVVRADRTGGLHVIVDDGGGTVWDARPLATAVRTEAVSYWWRPGRGAARVLVGPESGFPALAFEQSNPVLADRIRRDAVDALGAVGGKIAWDLYGGVGDTAQLLLERGATVWMVDRDRSAVAWAETRVRAAGGGTVHCLASRVEEALHRLPSPDAVVVNPPRAGVHHRVASQLEAWGGRHAGALLAYVSCDPATLARDLGRMPSFALRSVVAYDLFPQTSHVETLAVLEAR